MDFAEDKALLKNIEIIINIDATTSLIYVKLHSFSIVYILVLFYINRIVIRAISTTLIPVTQQNN